MTNDAKVLAGRVAIVTGSGQGIGRDGALSFAAAGAKVVVADIDAAGGAETVRRVREAGGEAALVVTDITSEESVIAMVGFALDTFGGLDCAFNNAGGGLSSPALLETTEEQWDAVVDLNLKGAFLCMKHELGHMVAQGRGAIVNTASAAAYRGSVAAPGYTAAKHGVAGLTKAAAIEVAARGVRVCAVCPGVTFTEGVVERRGPEGLAGAEALVRKNMPIQRFNTGSEIADTAVWLCSDAGSGLTGAVIPVDGGMSAV